MRFVRFCACAAAVAVACGGRREAPAISLTVAPATATVDAGGSQRFVARVTGADLPVAWSLAEGTAAGSIAADGAYSAPLTAGAYHVIAHAGDLTASAVVTVAAVSISITTPRFPSWPGSVSAMSARGPTWSRPAACSTAW